MREVMAQNTGTCVSLGRLRVTEGGHLPQRLHRQAQELETGLEGNDHSHRRARGYGISLICSRPSLKHGNLAGITREVLFRHDERAKLRPDPPRSTATTWA